MKCGFGIGLVTVKEVYLCNFTVCSFVERAHHEQTLGLISRLVCL